MKLIIRIAVLFSVVSPALAAENTGQKIDPALYAQRKESVNTYLLNIYIAQKRKPEAMAQYKTLLAMKPTDPKLNGDLGKFEASSGQFASAVAHLKKACELDPANPENWGALGATYLKMKEYDKALDAYNHAINAGERSNGLLGEKYREIHNKTLKYVEHIKLQERINKNKIKNSQSSPKQIKQDDDEW